MSNQALTPERFHVVLQAMPGRQDVPVVIRLRRVLKIALRSYGLKCVSVEPAAGVAGDVVGRVAE